MGDALICVVFTTLCAILNVRTNALITGAFLALELLALVVVTVLGFIYPARSWVSLVAHPVFLNAAGHIVPATIGVMGPGHLRRHLRLLRLRQCGLPGRGNA